VVYEPRTYRKLYSEKDLVHFQVQLGETDLDIAVTNGVASSQLSMEVLNYITEYRLALDNYINMHPRFLTTLEPYQPEDVAPWAVKEMCTATNLAGVGPMAAVAGLFSELTGRLVARYAEDVIVENGGDIWLKTSTVRNVAVFAGDSPFSYQIGLEIQPTETPLGICTSSGTVGHSLSFGRADAALILAPSAILADAVATATGNLIQNEDDLETAVDFAMSIPGVSGALVILGDKMAVKGNVKLVPL